VKIGVNKGRHYRILLTPNKLDRNFLASKNCARFIELDSKLRPQERWQTHTEWNGLRPRKRRIACHRRVCWWAWSLELQMRQQLSHGQALRLLRGWTPFRTALLCSRQTHTDRQTDASDLIICPMLCYSNWTDENSMNNISGASNTERQHTIKTLLRQLFTMNLVGAVYNMPCVVKKSWTKSLSLSTINITQSLVSPWFYSRHHQTQIVAADYGNRCHAQDLQEDSHNY